MKIDDDIKLPLQYRLLPYLLIGVALGLLAYAIFTLINIDFQPEDIGRFFKRIANGFNEA